MEYHLMLDPRLDLSARDFADAWNASPDCRAAAFARLAEGAPAQFDPALAQAGQIVLEGLLLGAAGNALYDLLKALFIRKGICRKIDIVEITRPDGVHILVTSIVEEE